MRTRSVSMARLAVVWVAAALVSACGDDDGATVDDTVTQLVGPAGGTVELPGGGKVTIPAGALATRTSIKISKVELDDLAPLPDNLESAGKPYAFEPHGQNFAQAVKIDVPFEGEASEVRPIKLDDEEDTTWQTVVGSTKNDSTKRLSLDTTSFSVIVAARPRRGSGVITLPDGATIPEDAGTSGEGGVGGSIAGSGGTGGTSGEGGVGGSIAGSGGGGAGTGGTGGIGTDDDGGVLGGSGGEGGTGTQCNGLICNSVCTDTNTDTHHCGGCDQPCDSGEQCVDGTCNCPLDSRCSRSQGGDNDAGGLEELYCADLQNDRTNCGGCNVACSAHELCIEGACAAVVCDATEARCGTSCVDAQSDVNNCGGCGMPSEDGEHGLLCYVEDYYCEYDCSYYYGGVMCTYEVGNTNECVDPQSDRDHCGACDNACADDEECVLGFCDPIVCATGEVACDGRCISGDSCGSVCGNNATCNQGSCECDLGSVECMGPRGGLECANLNTSNDHCGQCGYACGSNESCVNGTCECAGVNPAICEGCVDLDSDIYNCGGCYNYCESGETCVAGACVPEQCEAGRYNCGSGCVDIETDPYHCGGCVPFELYAEETCYIGESCDCEQQSLTTCAIEGPLGTCVDTNTNRRHCGSCGNVCNEGDTCISGQCLPIDCGTQTLCGNTCVDSPSCGEECAVGQGFLCAAGTCYQGT